MVIGVAHPLPPAPGVAGADPEDLAEPVRLRGDDGGRVGVCFGIGIDKVSGRGQDGRPGLGLAREDPGEPGEARPDPEALLGLGGELEHRPGARVRTGGAGRQHRRAGGQAGMRRVDRVGSDGDGLRVEHRQQLAGRRARRQRRPVPRPCAEDERPAALGDVGFEPGPGLGRDVGRIDVADDDDVEGAQRVGLVLVRPLPLRAGPGVRSSRSAWSCSRSGAGGRRRLRARRAGHGPGRCGGSGTPTAPRRRRAGRGPCRRRPGPRRYGGRCRAGRRLRAGAIATVSGTMPTSSIGTRKVTTGREPSAGASTTWRRGEAPGRSSVTATARPA